MHFIRLAAAAVLFLGTPAIAQQPSTSSVRGTVIDAITMEPLSAVQVAIRSAGQTPVIAGTLSGPNGRFLITGIGPGEYSISLSRLGYAPVERGATVGGEGEGTDLGVIQMQASAVILDPVDVVTERPAVVHAADRDVYAAESVAGAAGGSATDVLQGIPDLEVDINGNVTMHGESPAIYINGREAPMTGESLALFLEQFASENIDRVEVMPNPSARYDAQGSGGIVNIVLKENVGLGISGNAFVSGGTRGQFRTGGRATFQRGPLTLTGGASLGTRSEQRHSNELRQNLLTDPVSYLEQAGFTDRSSGSGNLDLEARYQLSDITQLIGEARLNGNVSESERLTRYTEMDFERTVTDAYDLFLLDEGKGRSMDFALELVHSFEKRDGGARREGPGGPGGPAMRNRGRDPFSARPEELRIQLEFDRGLDREQGWVERRLIEDLAGGDPELEERIWERDRETETEIEIGIDYSRALNAATRFEVGYEGEFGSTDEGRRREDRSMEGSEEPALLTDHAFTHRLNVHGGYLTLTREFGKLGAQVGLRAEHASNRLELPATPDVEAADHLDIFPSANLNYTLGGGKRLRLSYSMRVRRPSSRILNPVDVSSDPLNRRVGNPDIEPQHTHSVMLNASWTGRLGFLRATPFVRRTLNEWEELRTVDEDGIATTTWDNLGSTDSYGVSVTAGVRNVRGIDGRVSLNGRHTRRDYAAVLDRETPNTTRWSVRSHLSGELGGGLAAQGAVIYNPPRDLPQGRASGTVMSHVGLRYRFLERKAALNLNVTDPFDLYDSRIERSSASYIETGTERISRRALTLSMSYSFQSAAGPARGRGR